MNNQIKQPPSLKAPQLVYTKCGAGSDNIKSKNKNRKNDNGGATVYNLDRQLLIPIQSLFKSNNCLEAERNNK